METANEILNHEGSFEAAISDSHNETVSVLKSIIKSESTTEQLKQLIVKFDNHRCFKWLEDHAIDVMGEGSYFDFLDESGIE